MRCSPVCGNGIRGAGPMPQLDQSATGVPYLRAVSTDPRHETRVADLPVLAVKSGSCDVGSCPTRSVSLLVPSDAVPSWLGPMATLEAGVVVPGPGGSRSAQPLVCGVLGDLPRDDDPGVVLLEVQSPDAVLARHEVTTDRVLDGSALGALTALVRESLPGVRVDAAGVPDARLARYEISAGSSRIDAIHDLAAILAAEFGATRTGGLRLLPVESDPSLPPDLVYREGVDAGRLSASPAPQPNLVVVRGKGSGDDSVRGVAIDDRPWSPGYVGARASARIQSDASVDAVAEQGFAPILTRSIELPVEDSTSARVAARGVLLRGVRDGDASLTVPLDLTMEWGRLALVWRSGSHEGAAMVVTGHSIPMDLSPDMTLTLRSV